jgi:hypothetical protein
MSNSLNSGPVVTTSDVQLPGSPEFGVIVTASLRRQQLRPGRLAVRDGGSTSHRGAWNHSVQPGRPRGISRHDPGAGIRGGAPLGVSSKPPQPGSRGYSLPTTGLQPREWSRSTRTFGPVGSNLWFAAGEHRMIEECPAMTWWSDHADLAPCLLRPTAKVFQTWFVENFDHPGASSAVNRERSMTRRSRMRR